MTSSHLERHYEQGKLLEQRNHDGLTIVQPGEAFGDSADANEQIDSPFADVPTADSEISVNIKSRAENLKAALIALNEHNQKAGLSEAASYKPEIKERYGNNKGKKSAKEAKELLEQARQYFWKAYGHRVLKAAGIYSPEDLELGLSIDELEENIDFKDLDADVRLLWSEFRKKYAKSGRKTEKSRKDFIDQLDRIIEAR
jgi:hypothetical protein